MKKTFIFITLLLTAFAIGSINAKLKQEKVAKIENERTIKKVESPSPKYNYEVVSRTENKLDEIIDVLISSDETNPEGIALEVKKSCKKSCNISIYNHRKAFELDSQYTNMLGSYDTPQEDLTKWKEDNYVFVAEHLVALVGYGDSEGWGYGPYSEYPMKDWFYKELKGIK